MIKLMSMDIYSDTGKRQKNPHTRRAKVATKKDKSIINHMFGSVRITIMTV